SGEITAEELTRQYLKRIAREDPTIQAFEYVAQEQALNAARGVDELLRGGYDLGPLMGIPVAIKDVFVVHGYPRPRVGSELDLSDVMGSVEGPFIRTLKAAGCVIIGTVKSVEFCMGIAGKSEARGTP